MFNPKIYIPSNIKSNKANNALITESFQNNSIDLLKWFGIDLINGDVNKVLSKKGTWVSNGSPILTFNNGLTKTSNNIKLGGDLVDATTLISFNPTTKNIKFGNDSTFFTYGNYLGLSVGSFYGQNIFSVIGQDDDSYIPDFHTQNGIFGGTAEQATILYKKNAYNFGLFNSFDGNNTPFSNIYCGKVGDNIAHVKDLSRILVNPDKAEVAHIIDPTGVDTHKNCIIADSATVTIAYNYDDDLATGAVVTIDSDGVTFYLNGSKQFRINNSISSYVDDAAAITGGLTSGDVYKTTDSGSTFLKIVP